MAGTLKTIEINDLHIEGYERVIEVKQEDVHLHAIIVIHDTRLGPALGGIRAFSYGTFNQALQDVLRLAKGMTLKAAVAQTGTGGGKSVILTGPRVSKTPDFFLAFAEAVNMLDGKYICAEDLGIQVSDLAMIHKGTRFAVGLPHPNSSGDPSPFTSWGGYLGVLAVCQHVFGTPSVKGRTIAIQGLGAVGMKLAEKLFWGGARLVVTDIDPSLIAQAVKKFGAETVSPDEITRVPCDIFAPCALGGILNATSIPNLRCQAVAGLANNQLLTEEDGERLAERKILYAPDFVINSGGLLNVSVELLPKGYDPRIARNQVDHLFELLLSIFENAEKTSKSTSYIAQEMAEYNLNNGVGRRDTPIVFPS